MVDDDDNSGKKQDVLEVKEPAIYHHLLL